MCAPAEPPRFNASTRSLLLPPDSAPRALSYLAPAAPRRGKDGPGVVDATSCAGGGTAGVCGLRREDACPPPAVCTRLSMRTDRYTRLLTHHIPIRTHIRTHTHAHARTHARARTPLARAAGEETEPGFQARPTAPCTTEVSAHRAHATTREMRSMRAIKAWCYTWGIAKHAYTHIHAHPRIRASKLGHTKTCESSWVMNGLGHLEHEAADGAISP